MKNRRPSRWWPAVRLFTDEFARREVKAHFQSNCQLGSPLTSAIGPVAEDQGEARAASVSSSRRDSGGMPALGAGEEGELHWQHRYEGSVQPGWCSDCALER